MDDSDKMKQLIEIGNIDVDPYKPVPSARSNKELARKYPQLNLSEDEAVCKRWNSFCTYKIANAKTGRRVRKNLSQNKDS